MRSTVDRHRAIRDGIAQLHSKGKHYPNFQSRGRTRAKSERVRK